MRVALVNNGTKESEQLLALLREHEVSVLDPAQLNDFDISKSDLVVLSGSSRFPIMGNEHELEPEYSLVLNTQVPVIGICYGSELIARAFGGTLVDLGEANKARDLVRIEVVADHPMFQGQKYFEAYDAHRWTIETLPHDLEVMARSKHGPEVIRHRVRPIVGFQFHPEKVIDQSFGDEVFRSLVSAWTKTSTLRF